MLMDVLNSPMVIVAFFIVLAVFALVQKRRRLNRKCQHCGAGKMVRTSESPVGIIHSNSQTTGATNVRMRVKYQCNECGEFFVTEETRE